MIYILSIIFTILFLIYIIRLVKNNKLDVKYSIFWIIFSFGILILSIFPQLTEYISKSLGIYYAPSMLFLFGILFIIVYLIHLSIAVSKQRKQITKLTQTLAILEKENDKNRK